MTDTVQVPREAMEKIKAIADGRDSLDGFPRSIDERLRRLNAVSETVDALLTAAPQATDPRDAEIERLTRERDEALPWQMFYGEGKTLGEIADHFGKSVYAFSPWLATPLINSDAEAKTKEALTAAQVENEKLRRALREAIELANQDQFVSGATLARWVALSPPPLSPETPLNAP